MCFRIGTIAQSNKDSFGRIVAGRGRNDVRSPKDQGRLPRRQRPCVAKKELEPAAAR